MSDIRINSISKSYGDKQVLSGFSALLPAKGKTVIMGESGGGKTTLINILMGFEKADGGSIENTPKRFSAVFQDDCLSEDFSALSNLRAVVGKRLNADELSRYLLALGLKSEDISKPVRTLSGGMKRRVAIARALAAESDYVVMDEPFKGLDEELRHSVIRFILEDTAQKGRGLLVITHDPSEAEMLAPHKLILLGK